jgi:hypothetical protein
MRFVILLIFILGVGYHTFTFGRSLWKDEKNKLGAFGAILIAVLGTIIPLAMMWIRK